MKIVVDDVLQVPLEGGAFRPSSSPPQVSQPVAEDQSRRGQPRRVQSTISGAADDVGSEESDSREEERSTDEEPSRPSTKAPNPSGFHSRVKAMNQTTSEKDQASSTKSVARRSNENHRSSTRRVQRESHRETVRNLEEYLERMRISLRDRESRLTDSSRYHSSSPEYVYRDYEPQSVRRRETVRFVESIAPGRSPSRSREPKPVRVFHSIDKLESGSQDVD